MRGIAQSGETAATRLGGRAGVMRLVAQRPGLAVGLFIALHVVLWTVVPVLVHQGLPLDTVEAYAIGREWVIGTYKHPALPSWLLELSRIATGTIGWPAYLLSSLAVGTTYAFVYLLGRDTLGARLGLAGTLPLAGVMFFSWITPEFNHTLVQMPIWAAIVWCLWRAREGAGDARAMGWWMALGAVAGLGLYAKFSSAVLLVVAAVYILADARCRRQLRGPGPWLGLAAFVLAIAPLASWMYATDFQVLGYGATRAGSPKAGTVTQFMLKEAAAGLGLVVILSVAIGWRRAVPEPLATDIVRADARRFLLVFLLAPLALCIVAALLLKIGLRGAWGAAMLSFTGLALVALLAPRFNERAVLRAAALSLALLLVVPAAYGVYTANWSRHAKAVPKVAWPQTTIADGLEAVWRQRMGRPLRIVAGDTWVGGIVAIHGASRPRLLIDGDYARSPWISQSDVQREGALAVWAFRSKTPPGDLQGLIGERIDGVISVPIRSLKLDLVIDIYYTFVEPASGTPVAPPGRLHESGSVKRSER